MTHTQPPFVATWILERFCADEALAGDLVEEYPRRSVAWYWRQAMGAVGVFATKQVLEHKWLTLRAIATGWAIWFALNKLLMRGLLLPQMDTQPRKAVYLLIAYGLFLVNGWTIARLHRPYATAMVTAYAVFAVFASLPSIYHVTIAVLADATAWTSLALEVSARALTICSIVAGGLLSTARRRSRMGHPRFSLTGNLVGGWGL